MAGNDERVNLLISAAVDGLKNVEGLINDLQELEKSGRVELPDNTAGLRDGLGQTSEQMQGLAERLSELRNQQGLVTQFADLKRESKELAEQQALARQRATELGKALSETENPTRAQTQEFERARKAAKDADQAWIDNQRSLNTLRGSLDEAGISTKDLAGEQVRINKEIEGVNQQASAMSDELRQIKDSAESASQGTDQAADSAEKLGKEAETSSGLLSKLGTGLKAVATAGAALVAGIGASVATLTIFSKSQAAVADSLTNTSNAIGVNREALQVWQIAAERVGVSGEGVAKTLTGITERLGRLAATGTGRAGAVMESLNLDIEEFRRLAPDQQLIKFAAAIEGLPKGDQVALLRTLGSDAEKLYPLLENNAAGLRAIADEAAQAGAIYSEEELDKLNRANDVYNEISTKIQGLTRRIGAELAPVVGDATRRVMELFDQSGSAEKLIDTFQRLISWGEDLATNLLNNSAQIAQGFDLVWSTVKAGASGVVAAFRGIQTVVTAFLTVVSAGFANLMSAAQGLSFVLNRIGVISDEAYNNIRAKAEAARATTRDLANQTADYGRKALEAGKDVLAAFEPAEQKLRDTEDQARRTGDSFLKLGEDAESASDGLEEAARQAAALERAYKDLGVATQAELNDAADAALDAFRTIASNGEATQREIREAFEAYAKAVLESGDEARIRTLETVAANKGLRDVLKEVKDEAGGAAEAGAEGMTELADRTGDATREAEKLADAQKKAQQEAEQTRNKFREAWGDAFGQWISNARESVTALSAAARNLFEQKIGGNAFVDEAESASEALLRARQRVDEMARASAHLMNNSFGAWFADTALAAAQVEEKFWSQAAAVENLTARINDGAYSLSQLNQMAETAGNQFDLLDDQRLAGLQNAIDGARQRLQSLRDESTRTLQQLQDELLQLQGQEEELADRQQQRREDEIRAQIEAARAEGDRDAVRALEESLKVLQQIGQERDRQRREQEQQNREQERQRQQQDKAAATPAQAQAPTQSVRTVRIDLGGQSVQVLAGEEDKLIRALEQARSTAL